jgi:hypothetical protein
VDKETTVEMVQGALALEELLFERSLILRRFSFCIRYIQQRGPSTCQQYRILNRMNHEAFVWRLWHMHGLDVHDESNDCTIVSFIR